MMLAEALALRADLQRRLAQMRNRLQQSALVQEGEQPPENPLELLAEANGLIDQLTDLIYRINQINLQATISTGETITQAIARRDALATRFNLLSTLTEAAANRTNRYSRSEIRLVATVDVAALRRELDAVARERRELDTAIQATNWTTELPE
jgi:hypothetical protein